MGEQPDTLIDITPMLAAYSRAHTAEVQLFDAHHKDVVDDWERLGMLDTRRLVFVVHGFRSSASADWVQNMKDAMLLQMDQTVVTVDWSGGADLQLWKYQVAAANTLAVGHWLAKFAKEVYKRRPGIYIWGVGHSLGAHSLGMAGRQSQAFSRITGLDPAGPAFEEYDSDKRLKATDAFFMVDVIHTDGGEGRDGNSNSTPTKYFGTILPLGTIDFYPNFGNGQQPGASLIAGSHFRSYEFFNWTILNPGKFKTSLVLDGTPSLTSHIRSTKPSLRTAEMGYFADAYPPEERFLCYYIETNDSPPWRPLRE